MMQYVIRMETGMEMIWLKLSITLTLSGPGGGQMSPRFVLYALANLILTLEY